MTHPDRSLAGHCWEELLRAVDLLGLLVPGQEQHEGEEPGHDPEHERVVLLVRSLIRDTTVRLDTAAGRRGELGVGDDRGCDRRGRRGFGLLDRGGRLLGRRRCLGGGRGRLGFRGRRRADLGVGEDQAVVVDELSRIRTVSTAAEREELQVLRIHQRDLVAEAPHAFFVDIDVEVEVDLVAVVVADEETDPRMDRELLRRQALATADVDDGASRPHGGADGCGGREGRGCEERQRHDGERSDEEAGMLHQNHLFLRFGALG